MASTDFQEALFSTFISELEEYTNELDNDIIELESNPGDQELVNKIFRAYHSIKSSAGIVGFKDISNFTHIVETLMERIRQKEIQINNEITNGLLDSNDVLRNFLDVIQTRSAKDEEEIISAELKGKIDKVENIFNKYVEGGEHKDPGNSKVEKNTQSNTDNKLNFYDIFFKPNKDFFETGNEPLLYIKDLTEHGQILNSVLNPDDLPSFDQLDAYKCYLSWNLIFVSEMNQEDIKNLFMFIIDDNHILIESIDLSMTGKSDEELIESIKQSVSINRKAKLTDIQKDIAPSQNKEQGDINLDDIDVQDEAETDNKPAKKDAGGKAKKVEKIDYVKVDIKKLDELLNLIGELVINYSQVQTLIIKESKGEISQNIINTMDTFHNLTKEIQEKVMKVRMLPVGPMFNQFYRFVRDIAQKVGKKVKLTLHGTDTELDKTVIERITDPLRHIVRNAIDHGLESIEQRKEIGKQEEGNIKLSAFHREGNVVIEIQDDGKGMDPKKIFEKAVEKGLVTEEESEELTDSQKINFIFSPGFSTAEQVTDLSGRGVGMDVVKNNIEQLRGSVHLKTELGKGTTIQIILPLTLSIIEGMLIGIGNLTFVINIMSVIEIIKPEEKHINPVEGKAEVVNVRGEFLPLVRLHKEFRIENSLKNIEEAIVVIVEAEGRKFCLMADELIGQQQVVIKSLDEILDKAFGITGTTILGDGKIAFILDIPSLIGHLLTRVVVE